MTIKTFATLVELKAKTASLFPFILGCLDAWLAYRQFDWQLSLVVLVACVCLNMAVDANDNYQDAKRASRLHTTTEHTSNVILQAGIPLAHIRLLIWGLGLSSMLLGLWATTKTGWPLLVMGLVSFAVGFGYAGGPKPISTTPFGEVASGIAMGYIIWLIADFINASVWTPGEWLRVFVNSGLLQCAVAALMLANNIADESQDRALNRRTIVYYLGKDHAIKMLQGLYLIGYGALLLAVWLDWLPLWALLALGSGLPVATNVLAFSRQPDKGAGFMKIVVNLLLIGFTLVLGVALAVWLTP